jgi:hypothetical protein
MPPCIGERQTKTCIMRRCGEGAELPAIGEEIVHRQHRNPGPITMRLVTQTVVTARRKPRDPRSPGRLESEGTWFQGHGETSLPASGEELMAGRRDSRRRAMRSHTTSQTAPATRPPQTAVAASTGKR